MAHYSMIVDLARCYGCHTCEVACKQENDLPVGPKWIKVETIGPRYVQGRLKMDYMPALCGHCDKPACVRACPEKAIEKRSDGIVVVNASLCTGCKVCLKHCPFGALQFNSVTKKVGKCDFCIERIKKGLKPSCVFNCPVEALYFGKKDEIAQKLHTKGKRTIQTTRNSVIYIQSSDVG